MNNLQQKNNIPYIDVKKFSDLPNPPEGFRYVDFLSAPYGLRCFLLPKEFPRGKFMDEHEDLLDERLTPIYKHKGICVRPDSSFPIPGFYIVSPIEHYRSMDEMSALDNLRTFFIIRTIRKAMRDVLGIKFIYMFYEEKIKKHGDVHYWLLPIYDISEDNILLRLDIEKYLNKFEFNNEKDRILDFNNKLRDYIQSIDLLGQDNLLIQNLSYMN